MRKALITQLILFIFCLRLHAQNSSSPPSVDEIMQLVFNADRNIHTLRFNLKISERIDGKLHLSGSSVKIKTHPNKLYLWSEKAELLWLENENNNLVKVKPFTFPYFEMNLDAENILLRKGQHHSIRESGFNYFISIIHNNYEQCKTHKSRYFVLLGEEKILNRDCYKISVLNTDFSFYKYTVQKGETIESIARKLFLSEYMILENNPTLGSYKDVRAGDKINVPSSYSQMSVLFIDKIYYLPISTRIYDNKGFFEGYDYDDLKVNLVIPEEEFSPKYKDYHF